MSQFTCDICGSGFEQRSALERHMQTSHPPQAPSAADLESALASIAIPATRQELVNHATAAGEDRITELLQKLPERRYRDAAEVARACGDLRRAAQPPACRHAPALAAGG